jgi:hypothetical protein
MNVLTPRSDMTSVDRSWAARYQPNDVLHYTRGSKEHGIEKGSYATVVSADHKENLASGIRSKGRCLSCCTDLHCIAQDALGKCAVMFGAESSSTIIHRKMNRTLTPAHRS